MKDTFIKYSGKGSTKEKGPKKKGFGYQVLGFGSGVAAAALNPRGIIAGVLAAVNVIQYFDITTTGDAADFGDLTEGRRTVDGHCSSSTRAIWQGGQATATKVNTIDYVTIATTGDASDFGDITVVGGYGGGGNSDTRGVYMARQGSNTIDYITMASTGDSSDFGDHTAAKYRLCGTSNNIRSMTFGGSIPGAQNNEVGYITIATTGNASDFGDLGTAFRAMSACADSTRAVAMGGFTDSPYSFTNQSEYFTISSTGNSTDFGNITVARSLTSGTSNETRGINCGGNASGSAQNVIDYMTIQTTGDFSDFGDMTNSVKAPGANCGANGGNQT